MKLYRIATPQHTATLQHARAGRTPVFDLQVACRYCECDCNKLKHCKTATMQHTATHQNTQDTTETWASSYVLLALSLFPLTRSFARSFFFSLALSRVLFLSHSHSHSPFSLFLCLEIIPVAKDERQ